VAVFLTQPNGLPGAPQYLPAGDSPGGLLAADLDRDGKVDLVATNYFSDTPLDLARSGERRLRPRGDTRRGNPA